MPAKKPAPKKAVAPAKQTPEELRASLVAKQADLIEFRRSLAAGELANPRIVTVTRKDIARLKTALNAVDQTDKGEK